MSYSSPKFNGEPSVKALATGMATLGRYGDNYMVHAKDGETFVPGEVLDANPKLKSDLFAQMRVMGVTNPERFIVGNELNSINPITGQPEFFFKKIFKAVKKVFKKALPIIAPIVGNMIAPGIGGIIASGIVTKMQGGSWGDVAKSAALSYGLGALGAGASSAAAGKGFMTGLGEGLTAPFDAASNIFSGGPKNPLAQGVFGSGKSILGQSTDLGFSGGDLAPQSAFGSETLGSFFPTYQSDPAMATGFSFSQPQHLQKLNQPAGQVPFSEPGWRQAQAMSGQNLPAAKTAKLLANARGNQSDYPDFVNPNLSSAEAAAFQKSYVQAGGTSADVLGGGTGGVNTAPLYKSSGVFPQGAAIPGAAAGTTATGAAAPATSITGYETLDKMLTQAAVPAALAAITYFMADDEPELTPDQAKALADPQRSAYDRYLARGALKDAEGQALLAQAGIVGSSDPQTLATATGTSLDQAKAYLGSIYGNSTTAMAAKGGIMTLQDGGEIMGPGSGTSDSIPARLSDGEFVMTADAVRGAGNGSRNMGAARMYDLMSRFERAA